MSDKYAKHESIATKVIVDMREPFWAQRLAADIVRALASAGLLRESNDGRCQVVCERDDLRLRFDNQVRVNADLNAKITALEKKYAEGEREWNYQRTLATEYNDGWSKECMGLRGQIKTLTRERDNAVRDFRKAADERNVAVCERDEAERNTAQAIGQLDKVQRERDEALARAASPEVMRVIEDARELLEAAYPWRGNGCINPKCIALRASLDALTASRQPKAQEPRYYVSGNEVRERLAAPEHYRTSAAFYGHNHAARAEAECARLNAAERAK